MNLSGVMLTEAAPAFHAVAAAAWALVPASRASTRPRTPKRVMETKEAFMSIRGVDSGPDMRHVAADKALNPAASDAWQHHFPCTGLRPLKSRRSLVTQSPGQLTTNGRASRMRKVRAF